MNYLDKIEIEEMVKELSPDSKIISDMMLLLLATEEKITQVSENRK